MIAMQSEGMPSPCIQKIKIISTNYHFIGTLNHETNRVTPKSVTITRNPPGS